MIEQIQLISSVSTIILAVLAIMQIFFKILYVDANNVELGTIQKIGKSINRIFSIIGAFSIIIIALEVVAIMYIAPRWDFVNKFQESVAVSIAGKIAPSLRSSEKKENSDNVKHNEINTNFEIFNSKFFNAFLTPATRTSSEINIKVVLENTTKFPIFIALNKDQIPVLTDDDFSFTSHHRDSNGIAWVSVNDGGKAKEESSYTKILPGKRLDIGMEFRPYPRKTPNVESKVHVTLGFIYLLNGDVEAVSATPGTLMRYQ